MAATPAALAAEPRLQWPLFFPPRQRSLASPLDRGLTSLRMTKPLCDIPPSPSMVPPRPCAAGTLDPEPAEGGPSSSAPVSATGAGDVVGKEGGKERRRAVRIAWEKLVRWSRSWRSKAKSDVLERTKKVTHAFPTLISFCMIGYAWYRDGGSFSLWVPVVAGNACSM